MNPVRTPPAHIKGDYLAPRIGEGLLIFSFASAIVTLFCLVVLRYFVTHYYPVWAGVSLIKFPADFFRAYVSSSSLPLSFYAGVSFIVTLWLSLAVIAGWLGTRTSRPAGGDTGVYWLSGPVLQKSLQKKKKKDESGIIVAHGVSLSDRDQCRHMLLSGVRIPVNVTADSGYRDRLRMV